MSPPIKGNSILPIPSATVSTPSKKPSTPPRNASESPNTNASGMPIASGRDGRELSEEKSTRRPFSAVYDRFRLIDSAFQLTVASLTASSTFSFIDSVGSGIALPAPVIADQSRRCVAPATWLTKTFPESVTPSIIPTKVTSVTLT